MLLEKASQGKPSFSGRGRRQGTPVCLGKPSKSWELVPECFTRGPLCVIRAIIKVQKGTIVIIKDLSTEVLFAHSSAWILKKSTFLQRYCEKSI